MKAYKRIYSIRNDFPTMKKTNIRKKLIGDVAVLYFICGNRKPGKMTVWIRLKPTGVYVRSGTTSVPTSEDAIRMMIKISDGDSFESNRSLIQELTFDSLNKEMERRNLEFSKVQMKKIGILMPDEIYTNLGLLVSDQCKHSIKFAVFQGTDKLVFRDRKELTGSLFDQLIDAWGFLKLG